MGNEEDMSSKYGIRDEDEITPALDENGDGILDECQDCNGNGEPDSQDILNDPSLARRSPSRASSICRRVGPTAARSP